ncbi:MAG: alanine racemase [Gammaproteobacteria bacterium]
MTRPACVVIDPCAARHNLARVRAYAPAARVMAVVKADGYGHGLVRMARAFADADALGVACAEEALALRQAGVDAPVVLLEGAFDADELAAIRGRGIAVVVHHEGQVEMLEHAPTGPPLKVWVKLDTGMHRLGFEPRLAGALHARLSACANVAPRLGFMTHLACSHAPADHSVDRQIEAFQAATRGLDVERSIANSGAVIAWPGAHCDWVRPGLMLYGASPLDDRTGADFDLRPVMTLRSELIAVRWIDAGETVGYGGTWRSPERMPIGVIAMGYGDGFPRHAQSGTPALVDGARAQLIGRPSMDMLCVDLRACPRAQVGAPVVLWGRGLPVEEIARHAQTVPYQLMCSVKMRARFVEDG